MSQCNICPICMVTEVSTTVVCCAITVSLNSNYLQGQEGSSIGLGLYPSYWAWMSIHTDQMSYLVFTDGVSLFIWVDSRLSVKNSATLLLACFVLYFLCILCLYYSANQLSSYHRVPTKAVSSLRAKITNTPYHFLVFLHLCRSMSIIALVLILALYFNSTVLSTSCSMVSSSYRSFIWGQSIDMSTAGETPSWTMCPPIPICFPMLISLKAHLQPCFLGPAAWFGWSSFQTGSPYT